MHRLICMARVRWWHLNNSEKKPTALAQMKCVKNSNIRSRKTARCTALASGYLYAPTYLATLMRTKAAYDVRIFRWICGAEDRPCERWLP